MNNRANATKGDNEERRESPEARCAIKPDMMVIANPALVRIRSARP